MDEDYSDFFDDFAESATYSYGGSDTAVNVILDRDIRNYDEFVTVKAREFTLTLPYSVVGNPRKGATVTVDFNGSPSTWAEYFAPDVLVIFTLGDEIENDGFVIVMEATK